MAPWDVWFPLFFPCGRSWVFAIIMVTRPILAYPMNMMFLGSLGPPRRRHCTGIGLHTLFLNFLVATSRRQGAQQNKTRRWPKTIATAMVLWYLLLLFPP